jgi:hypothetical protein
MNFIVHADRDLGEYRLTSEDLFGSQRSAPLLVIADRAFRPNDMIEVDGKGVVAARLVSGWAANPDRTEAELDAARQYLRQWPAGPQLDQSRPSQPRHARA